MISPDLQWSPPWQVVAQGLSVKSEWLFAADVDKHAPSPSITPLSPSNPSRPRLDWRADSFDLRFE